MEKSNLTITCEKCKEATHIDNVDELVFMNGDDCIYSISEQYPDWTHAYCGCCAIELNLI